VSLADADEAAGTILWSGPDTPLVTFNDIVRGAWRGSLKPDGTLFAWVLHNYWSSNFPARQGGELRHRFRISLLPAGDVVEPVRRGWAACDPLRVSEPYESGTPGPLLERDRALFFSDPNLLLVAAKPADDGEGAVLRLLDVARSGRPASIWPAAFRFTQARRVNLVEMNEGPLNIAADGRVTFTVPQLGVASLRLFTPREGAG
jgi:alpha-mannosidase